MGVYTFFSTIFLAFGISNVFNIIAERKRLRKAETIAEKKMTLEQIKMLDTGHGVPRDTFLLAVLERIGVLDRERDIEPWIKVDITVHFQVNFPHMITYLCTMPNSHFQKFAEFDAGNTGIISQKVSS